MPGHLGRQRFLKTGNDQPGKGGRNHQQGQPGNPMFEQIQGRRPEIGLVAGRHTGHDLHVLCGLVLHNVHGIVEGYDPHHPVVHIDHGNRQQIVFPHDPGDFFLIRVDVFLGGSAGMWIQFHH